MLEAARSLMQQHAGLLGALFTLSLVLLVIGLIALPVVLVKLPADALRRHLGDTDHPTPQRHPVLHIVWVVAKNLLGVVLAIAGLAMLVLPGQGLLSLIVALALLDLPGKQRVERRLLSSPKVLGGVNRLRQRFKQPPLLKPDPPTP